jgi:SAM-dependent methyltransferase
MSAKTHPWENIYRNNCWPYDEPFPRFGEVLDAFQMDGCRRILDLGCGNGRHAVQFEKGGIRTVGADISPTGLNLMDKRFASDGLQSKLVLTDCRFPLPFRDNSFDGLFSTGVIHHARITEVRLAISEIWRIISPGGLIFVTVSGKLDEGETFEEIEANTFVPLTGDEKGLPHHIFNLDEARDEFRVFVLDEVSLRADGHVLAILGRKPKDAA